MKFGQVADPSQIDFTLPKDHPKTKEILAKSKGKDFNIYIGCAKWNKTDLKGFYPKLKRLEIIRNYFRFLRNDKRDVKSLCSL